MSANQRQLTFEEAFPPTPPHDDNENGIADDEIDVMPAIEAVIPVAVLPVAADDAFSDDDDNEDHDILMQTIRDNIIAPSTHKSYFGHLIKLVQWIQVNENDWLTVHGNTRLTEIFVRPEMETDQEYNARTKTLFEALLREASTNAVAHLERFNTDKYMKFLLTHRAENGAFLSKSSYNNKRAALNHFFRLHNKIGLDVRIKAELSNMFKGLNRQITIERRRAQRRPIVNNNDVAIENNENENNENENNENVHERYREGKSAMSVVLYTALCKWFLQCGTSDGIFAHCYLILSWNLACRCNNTGRIKFSDIDWSQSFDSFSVLFSQTKTDQLGEEAKYPRHIYANPLNPLVCPVLSLAMYFTTCFQGRIRMDNFLFPGRSQDARFAIILQRIINEKWADIRQLGYHRGDLGTHSIRKGAVSYASSLPGGPSGASVCIRAGWTMGTVHDIYMRYVASGDQFVGRCLSLLSVLRTDFAASPPFFIDEAQQWINDTQLLQFQSIGLVNGMERITKMCLASIVYHFDWAIEFLDVNHVFIISSHVHQMVLVRTHRDSIRVSYPWNDSAHHFSGIPPHVVTMQSILKIEQVQAGMVGNITAEMRQLLQQMGIDGTRMSEQNIMTQFNNLHNEIQQLSQRVGNQLDAPVPAVAAEEHGEHGGIFMLHFYGGSHKRVPIDWRFPRCGILALWRQWLLGNTARNYPPLQSLEPSDVNHLDHVVLSEAELHGRTGLYRNQRRKARKTLCDMRFLMRYIESAVQERNLYPETITAATVDQMFQDVSDLFDVKDRSPQIRWESVVRRIRKERRENVANGNVQGENE